MELDERKRLILGAIVENYINYAEPIGSRTVAKLALLDISPATIRNVMADLEEMGLLEQPHASSGRIPSHLGYRFYVDRLMQGYQMPGVEAARLNMMLHLKIAQLEELIREITNIYSRLTSYTVLSSIPEAKKEYIKHIQLFPLDAVSVMIIIVTDKNAAKDKSVFLRTPIDTRIVAQLSAMLAKTVCMMPISDIDSESIRLYADSIQVPKELMDFIFDFIHECFVERQAEIFTGGTTNLLDHPEYKNIQRAKRLLSYLENKTNLSKVLTVKDNVKIKIIIGNENEDVELRDCSVVLSTYKKGDNTLGAIGVIGPTRMNYAKTVSHLGFFTDIINELVKNNFTEVDEIGE